MTIGFLGNVEFPSHVWWGQIDVPHAVTRTSNSSSAQMTQLLTPPVKAGP